MGVIYLRTNKINGKKYVGQVITRRFKQRQRDWNCLLCRYAGNAINNARAKYGLDAFDFEILKECKDEELNQWEMYYIKELNTRVPYGYNLTDGGDGCCGYSLTEEHKKKIGKANKGHKVSEEGKLKLRLLHLGKPINQETKKKISKALKNRKRKPHSEETKKKISEKAKGRKHTEEWKIKMSETLKGRKFSEETRKRMSEIQINGSHSKPILQIDKETNDIIKEWPSISEVERQIGIDGSLITRCCKNKPHHKSAGGYKWQYK